MWFLIVNGAVGVSLVLLPLPSFIGNSICLQVIQILVMDVLRFIVLVSLLWRDFDVFE